MPQREVDKATSIPERFLIRWRGEADPDHVKAIDAYWISAAEHGMNASTFTARVVASTGADVAAALSAAVGALSGPLHGGAPARVLKMLDEVEQAGDAEKWVKEALDKGERLMGFGHRVYRAEDPRAARAAPHLARDRLGALRGRRGAREGRAGRAEGAQARPRAGHQRRVLVGGRARPRRRPLADVHEHVHLRAHGRLGGAHPRAEARGAADPAVGEVRRARRRASCQPSERRPRALRGSSRSCSRVRRRRAGRSPAAACPRAAAPRPRTASPCGVRTTVFTRRSRSARPALGEAGGLEPVDDPGDVGVVALQRAGERAHRQRLVGLEVAERHRLLEREPELGEDRHPARLVGAEDAPEQAPRLLRRRC